MVKVDNSFKFFKAEMANKTLSHNKYVYNN